MLSMLKNLMNKCFQYRFKTVYKCNAGKNEIILSINWFLWYQFDRFQKNYSATLQVVIHLFFIEGVRF